MCRRKHRVSRPQSRLFLFWHTKDNTTCISTIKQSAIQLSQSPQKQTREPPVSSMQCNRLPKPNRTKRQQYATARHGSLNDRAAVHSAKQHAKVLNGELQSHFSTCWRPSLVILIAWHNRGLMIASAYVYLTFNGGSFPNRAKCFASFFDMRAQHGPVQHVSAAFSQVCKFRRAFGFERGVSIFTAIQQATFRVSPCPVSDVSVPRIRMRRCSLCFSACLWHRGQHKALFFRRVVIRRAIGREGGRLLRFSFRLKVGGDCQLACRCGSCTG